MLRTPFRFLPYMQTNSTDAVGGSIMEERFMELCYVY